MNTRTYKVNSIQWDTDGEDVPLPKEVRFITNRDEATDEETIADYLSDTYGWCVLGFKFSKNLDSSI